MSILSQSNQSFSPNKASISNSKFSQKSPSCNQILKGFHPQKSINDQDLSFQVKLQNLNTKKPLQSTFMVSQPKKKESQQNLKLKMDKILYSQLDQSLKSGNPLSQTFKSFINKNEDKSSQYNSAQNSQSTSGILAQQINQVPIQLQQDPDIKVLLEQIMYDNQSFDKSQDGNQVKSLKYLIDVNLNQTQNENQLNFNQSVTPSIRQLDLQKQENSFDILQLRNQVFQNQKPISLKDLQLVFAGRNESDQFPTEMFKTPTQGHNNEFFTFTAEEKKEQLLKNLMEKITIDENQLQKNELQNSNQSKINANNTQKGFQKRKSAVQMQFEPVRKLDFIGQILSAGSFKQRINLKCDKSKNKDLLMVEANKIQNQMSLQEFIPVRKFDTIIQKNQLHRDASVNVININNLDKENESLLFKSSSKQFKSQISQRNSKSNDRLAKSFSGMTINLNFNHKILEKSKNRPETVVRPSQLTNNNKNIEKTMEPMIILQKPQFEQKQNLSQKKNNLNGQNKNQKLTNIKNYSLQRESKPRLSINSQIPQITQFQSLATCKNNQYNSFNHASMISTAQPTQRFSKIGNQKQFECINNNRSFSKIQDNSLQMQNSNSKIFKTFDHMKQKPSQQQNSQKGNKFKSVFSNQNNDLVIDKISQICNTKEMNQNKSQKYLGNYSSTKSLSVTRQKSQNVNGQTQQRNLQQPNYISQKKEDPEASYILKVREQAEQAQKQLFKISQIQAQKKKEKLMKKNNGFFQNNVVKENVQAKVEQKQLQNSVYNPFQRSKMDPALMPILQNKNNPSVIRQPNKLTLQRPLQSKETFGISAQVKILKQSSDISKFKNPAFNFDEQQKNKKESPSQFSQKNKQNNLINLNSQTSKNTILKSQSQNQSDAQNQFLSNQTTSTAQIKQEFDSNKNLSTSQNHKQIKDNDFEQQIDNEYITLQNQVKHLLYMDDNFDIIQNQETEMKNINCYKSEKSEFNSQSQKQLQQMKSSFTGDFKIDFIQEVFCQPSQNIRDLNLSIQGHDINITHQKSQAEKIDGSPQKNQTPYIDCQFFLIKTQERQSRKDKRTQKRANQYKSMIERTNSRSKSNESKTNDIQKVSQSIYKEIYHDKSQDAQQINSNKSQYTSSSLHHKKNSSSIKHNIEQCSNERKNKFDKLQKSLKFLKFNFGNVIKGYKARRIIYNIKELRQARLKAIVYQQLSQNNNQCYENKILEQRQNLAFLYQKYWANNQKQNAIDWIKMGQQKEVKNDKKQLNLEKQQVLDEIEMNIKFLQSLNNSERKDNSEQMMEETVVFNMQNNMSCKHDSVNNEIDQYIQNVDEDVKAIQIEMTDSVEDLDCTVQIQQNHLHSQSNIQEANSNHYRSVVNSTKNQQIEKSDSEISNKQNKNKQKKQQAQNRCDNKTFRSMIPQIIGENIRSRSQNRSKSRFSLESSRIPRINPIVQRKQVKIGKQSIIQNKNSQSNMCDLITIEIKPVISKPSSIRNDKKLINKKRDIYQSYDEQGFTLIDKKSSCKENSKKLILIEQKYKKNSQSKLQSPIKEITPQKQKVQPLLKQDLNKENPEYKQSTKSKKESTQAMNLLASKSVQFFENKKVLEEEVDELCCEALKDMSNSSLNINNSFYSQNKAILGEKQSMFPLFPPEFMKLIELNKRKKELSGLDKYSKAQLKSAISELMKELDDNE